MPDPVVDSTFVIATRLPHQGCGPAVPANRLHHDDAFHHIDSRPVWVPNGLNLKEVRWEASKKKAC